MSFEASVETRVPVAQAWAWWTDFGPVGSQETLDHGTGKTLRVVKERVGDRVVMEERIPLPGGRSLPAMRHEVVLREAERSFVETGPTYESRWRFEATPQGGTRIVRVMFPKGLGRLAPDGISRMVMERDLKAHVAAMERDVAPVAQATPSKA